MDASTIAESDGELDDDDPGDVGELPCGWV
jgi:hypothetical protein